MLPQSTSPSSSLTNTSRQWSSIRWASGSLTTAWSTCLVGASASAKNGKYYAVDAAHAKAIAQRFRFWPEAAMTYFGILVSPCKVCVEIPNARVSLSRITNWARMTAAAGSGAPTSSVFICPTVGSTSSGCPSRTRRQRAASRSWRTMSRCSVGRYRHSTIELQARVQEARSAFAVSNRCRPHQRAIFHRPGGDRDSGDLARTSSSRPATHSSNTLP